MKKINLLIATVQLAQAGSERWIYEVCRHLDKDRFLVTILIDVTYEGDTGPVNQQNYYIQKIRDLGIEVVPGIQVIKQWPHPQDYAWRARNLLARLTNQRISFITRAGKAALQSADIVCVIDAYLYEVIGADLEKWAAGKFFTVLHCHKIQFPYDLYRSFDKSRPHIFGYFCPKQIEDLESSGFSIQNTTLFYNPLLVSLSALPVVYQPVLPHSPAPVVIGIFTRITRMKPLEPFIDAFVQLLLLTDKKCILNIYGAELNVEYGNQLRAYIQKAGLSGEAVHFKGHAQDMAEAIIRDKVNLYWGIAQNTSIGYAGIEVGAMGVPSFFMNWDTTTDYQQIMMQTAGAMHVHRLASEMAEDVADHLDHPEKLRVLSELQRRFLVEKHETSQGIAQFEEQMEHLLAERKKKEIPV